MIDSSTGSALGDMTTGFLGATVDMLVGFLEKSGELFFGSAS
ncbi:hypothetical protein [Dietzia aerolata]|uniref:Porin n=1 Tax=Dietzia aerolata TaxID=595984 RepID=A0ABV5JVZ6_9ACTN|nr:hypothetical protein [Dietzia aerolata]